jgi:3-hydroxybutyryl-CoA dehydrogenase
MEIGIIGSGTMGAGIAQVAAQASNKVIVVDKNEAALEKAKANLTLTLKKLVEKEKMSSKQASDIESNISWTGDLKALKKCNLVIEAIVENLEVKNSLFTEIETIVSEDCILASNTSSLSITELAANCKHPERFIGIHFFNPAPIMKLVEIIPAMQTKDDVVETCMDIIKSWHKHPAKAKDTPGFIVNRIARPYYSEALRIYEEGIASIEEIDIIMKTVGGFKMGPFELMDMIGHDVNYVVTETVWKSFYYDTKYTPSISQKKLVEARWYGKKSGRGFYDYSVLNALPKELEKSVKVQQKIADRILVMLINEAANAFYMNVASVSDIDMAMTMGVNYPKGLLSWADDLGIDFIVDTLDDLYNFYHEERYRCCVLLRKMMVRNQTFY